ncbi:RNA polymerase II transcription mediator complex subunit 9-domain-containing protein [Sphaerosporella brunnea]|uniref:Mediator of RNA polymerase II transcription subunit 9 n=1 Tax=Sphaerosporella brunnea TaxID=1250544 RepID=A0A5J5FA76_9PEZI|nr:RNA polymerase II transcription mediator complex subunit 9-domain-containing protein [Sphaerosporella brunnea]
MATPNATAAGDTPIPPNAFDFVPDLHELIQRVYSDEIDAKDIAHESNALRLKIAKARNLVASLPDANKSAEEQRAEIRALEERIAKQRLMLTSVAELDVVKDLVESSGKMQVDR